MTCLGSEVRGQCNGGFSGQGATKPVKRDHFWSVAVVPRVGRGPSLIKKKEAESHLNSARWSDRHPGLPGQHKLK